MTKKRIIRLSEIDLHRIIKESVNQYLNESNEHVLYHNTEISTLIKMIEENKMFFSKADRCQANIRGGKTNYLSLTRYKGDYEGFQSYNMCNVRITIDNDKFQSIMRQSTEPMEAYSAKRWGWGEKSAKAHHQNISKLNYQYNGDVNDIDDMYNHFGDYYDGEHLMFPEEFVQAEESMNTNLESISNPLRFIIRIDIRNTDNYLPQELIDVLNSHPKWKDKIFFHKNGLDVKD